MGKNFAPRVSKRKRKTIDMSEKLDRDLFKVSDDRLLKGAKLAEIFLKDIKVKDQVRTKFNDSSIKELAKNIQANGLIQPLVLHRTGSVLTLICGERRFRAMSSINLEQAPCFILEGKNEEELMAIQFSENSSRESLHFIDRADGILNYQKATKASERKICQALGISKSEVHRSLMIAKLPKKIKEAAKQHDVEKYVLVEFDALDKGTFRKKVESLILKGEVTKRSQLKKVLATGLVKVPKSRARKTATIPRDLTAQAFLKAMNSKTKDLKLDKKTREILKNLVSETKDMVDL